MKEKSILYYITIQFIYSIQSYENKRLMFNGHENALFNGHIIYSIFNQIKFDTYNNKIIYLYIFSN